VNALGHKLGGGDVPLRVRVVGGLAGGVRGVVGFELLLLRMLLLLLLL
jgi:hypothetical protein